MNNPPNKDAVWDEKRKRWRMGDMFWMPDKTIFSPWCFYDFDKDRVIASGDPERVVRIHTI